MPTRSSILPLVALTTAFIAQPAECDASPADVDMKMIAARLWAEAAAAGAAITVSPSDRQTAEGRWADIDYGQYAGRSAAQQHLQRLLKMSIDLRDPVTVRNLNNGLLFWLSHRPRSPNWWDNEIGQQLIIEQILLLANGHVPTQTIMACATLLGDPDHPKPDMPPLTGENLAWIAEQQIVRGVLLKNETDINNGVHGLEQAVKVTSYSEGSQVDGSFHQHGAQIYLGGYGLELIKDELGTAAVLAGTRFTFSQATLSELAVLLLNGMRAVTYREMIDVGTMGRNISRPGNAHLSSQLIAPLENLKAVMPDRGGEADDFKNSILRPDAGSGFFKHTHFWKSDYSAHHEGNYYVSVKMVSDRTVGTETINGENARGFWTPFGLTLTSLHGGEYDDVFPLWDWAHLPGVTATAVVPPFTGELSQPADFVGGVSDGRYGASAMVVALDAPVSLHAHKAWFFFPGQVVALGAGISAPSGKDVHTAIEQANLSGSVLLNGQAATSGTQDLAAGSWLLHHGIGYVLLEPARLHLAIGPRTGAWADINTQQSPTRLTRQVFEVDIEHKSEPVGGHYAYAILPGLSAQDFLGYAPGTRVKILANTPGVQAVVQDDGKRTEAIFYEPGRIDLLHGWSIAVDRACMLMLARQGGAWSLSLASPADGGTVKVSLRSPSDQRTATLLLPNGDDRGRTQSMTIDTNEH